MSQAVLRYPQSSNRLVNGVNFGSGFIISVEFFGYKLSYLDYS